MATPVRTIGVAPLGVAATVAPARAIGVPRMRAAPAAAMNAAILKSDPKSVDTPVAITGGDVWSGARATKEEVRELADDALSSIVKEPIMAQFYTGRLWLWGRWSGTIIRAVLPREVVFNVCAACVMGAFFTAPWIGGVETRRALIPKLVALNQVWLLASSLVTFTISFFLSQAYAFWRDIYSRSRKIQGRLNDLGLAWAGSVARAPDGTFTEDAEALLQLLARYVRLFHVLLYASVTTKYAPLKTPAGLSILIEQGGLTEDERERLLEASTGHNAVLGWMWTASFAGLGNGAIGAGASLQRTLESELLELRSLSAGLPDALSGRMPLAYTQLVQILVDLLIVAAPLALLPSIGAIGAVVATGFVTLFYSSVLNLAKVRAFSSLLYSSILFYSPHPPPSPAAAHDPPSGLPRPFRQRELLGLRLGPLPTLDAQPPRRHLALRAHAAAGDQPRLGPLVARRGQPARRRPRAGAARQRQRGRQQGATEGRAPLSRAEVSSRRACPPSRGSSSIRARASRSIRTNCLLTSVY